VGALTSNPSLDAASKPPAGGRQSPGFGFADAGCVPGRSARTTTPARGLSSRPTFMPARAKSRYMSELTYIASRWLKGSRAPNTALQRTRSAPLRSPLSFKTLGEAGNLMDRSGVRAKGEDR
jgi:hypothetical protein